MTHATCIKDELAQRRRNNRHRRMEGDRRLIPSAVVWPMTTALIIQVNIRNLQRPMVHLKVKIRTLVTQFLRMRCVRKTRVQEEEIMTKRLVGTRGAKAVPTMAPCNIST